MPAPSRLQRPRHPLGASRTHLAWQRIYLAKKCTPVSKHFTACRRCTKQIQIESWSLLHRTRKGHASCWDRAGPQGPISRALPRNVPLIGPPNLRMRGMRLAFDTKATREAPKPIRHFGRCEIQGLYCVPSANITAEQGIRYPPERSRPCPHAPLGQPRPRPQTPARHPRPPVRGLPSHPADLP